MGSSLICIATVLLGVDVGWQPLPEGGVAYLIQIEPEAVEGLRRGMTVSSDILPMVRDVRAFRITVGRETLPRELPQEPYIDDTVAVPAGETPEDSWPGGPYAPPNGAFGENLLEDPAAAPSAPAELPLGGAAIPLTPGPDSVAKASHTARVDGLPDTSSGAPVSPSDSPSDLPPATFHKPEEPPRPWNTLLGVAVALTGSLFANAYLCVILRDAHRKYRKLVFQKEGPMEIEAGNDGGIGSDLPPGEHDVG